MDTERFQKNIEQADSNSLRIGAANRVLQLLQKLRYSNNENSAKRWVWELCQNAKDICNNTGKVKIAIAFDEGNKKVVFKHNGKAFSITNVMSLINQSSSKDRNDGVQRTSGKFGTGFLTTHLLSEIVDLSGILETEAGGFSNFHFTLDRTGHEQKEIVRAMEKAVQQLMECTPLRDVPDWEAYNTIFEYALDEDGIEVAKQGIENLRVTAPFVLSMIEDIEEIFLESTGEVFRYNQSHTSQEENALVHEILYESKITKKNIYILNLTEDGLAISAGLERNNNSVNFISFAKGQPKLFCDFPLIGTEDFPFPVVINSSDFNPTEPRDGIYLSCKSKNRIDDEIEQNRKIIEKACGLYTKLLAYAAKRCWGGIYHITHIDTYEKKDWYDEEWIKAIINNCKDTILNTEIIQTSKNEMLALQDWSGVEQVYIISDANTEIREEIWELLYPIMPERIPCKANIHDWYFSLWSGCNRYTLKNLTEQLQEYGGIEQLQEAMPDYNWQDWLLRYYDLVEKNKKLQEYIFANKIRILPDQSGKFHCVSELHYDKDILEEYKNILDKLGADCRSWLLDSDLPNREWFQAENVENGQMLRLIEDRLEEADGGIRSSILFLMVFYYEKDNENLDIQQKICRYASDIFKTNAFMLEVPLISKKILQEALKYTLTCVADKISEYADLKHLSLYMSKSMEDTTGFLAEFIEFIVQTGYENLINKSKRPILPNQNGIFVIKDDIFLDSDMVETLKELAVSAGYDIKAELLMKQVYLKMPENRVKKDCDIVPAISQYVNANRTSKDDKVRTNFKKLLLWMTDNSDKAKEIFPELYKNKHYLYDDEEITSNIRKAEILDDIMEKYSITSAKNLEEIIRIGQVGSPEENVRSEITPAVLLQYGIESEEALNQAFTDDDFAEQFYRPTKHNQETYEYVKSILERSKTNIFSYLRQREDYDLSEIHPASDTIFIIKKNGKEIYLLARPSDGGEVRIYYREEQDILDYSRDWELWVEDGKLEPKKLTFGKIIKLTGLNRIPLRGL
ncbi:ATP-binding protein [Enterocloster citroniae]